MIAQAGGKLLSSPDPEADPHAAKLFTALTELRGLFADARLELADDFGVVGWDGEAVGLVDDPDQELTALPQDRTAWFGVPARRGAPAKPAAPRSSRSRALALPPALDAALSAVRTGGDPGDLSGLGTEDASALLRAIAKVANGKSPDFELLATLRRIAAQLPARAIVDAALADARLLDVAAPSAVEEAMERLADHGAVREAVLSTWRLALPTKDPARRLDAICSALLLPLASDPWLIAQLGDEEDAADFVTTGHAGDHFHRDHRGPGDQAVAARCQR